MKLTSPAFKNNSKIPSKYTCDGENINPELRIEDIPEDSESLVLIMNDPDVPKSIKPDGMWDHWIIFNMPPNVTVIHENEQPKGVYGRGTGGSLKYGGPCPPDREHRYFFKVYSLDAKLNLLSGATKKEVENAMKGHILEKAELIGRYERRH